ncbi:GNAT family N-acetyltransferase [Sutcliffiella rhizosphaerae]|uniref:N-acetyltransferase domain-containing protein n=1 Tax=Sutcliffiella rhizosphaerae TaxID=2880967 RepID=A0ABM8YJQ6_9BACI|nr:GNAT family N-acetyltransferase [Sutcliffiella rhizosphaerae]CAG9620173.1 hypothetical protein BACCIP111883_00941 [Sutcliffiella rhizosphaerae]
MITKMNINNVKNAKEVLNIQIPSYKVEAAIIGVDEDELPPLKDTVETLQQSGETFYGYYIEEKVCGVISFMIENEFVNIHRLVVHPDHFRKGIASQLLTFVLTNYPAKTTKVATAVKNTPAVMFYESNGFQKVREVFIHDQLSLVHFEREGLDDYQ